MASINSNSNVSNTVSWIFQRFSPFYQSHHPNLTVITCIALYACHYLLVHTEFIYLFFSNLTYILPGHVW